MCKNQLIVIVCLLSALAHSASATFISPGKVKLEFEPNLEKDLIFYVGGAANINVTISGQYREWAQVVSVTPVHDANFKDARRVIVHLKLPEFIEKPGENKIAVVAREVSPGGGMISAAVQVSSPIRIYVPYPGIYVLTQFIVPDVNENETVELKILANNRGYENISMAWGEIDILREDESVVTTLETERAPLLSREEKPYTAEWDTLGYPAGPYKAFARFFYRDNVTEMRHDFRIGNLVVNILNFTRSVEAESINPFGVIVQGGWNSPIQNVYAIVTVNGTSFQTPSESLEPWEIKELKGYFDTKGIKPGTYNADVVAYFHGRTALMSGDLEIVSTQKSSLLENPALIYGGMGFILLTLLLTGVIMFLVLRRKREA
jgi:hypothetical protein